MNATTTTLERAEAEAQRLEERAAEKRRAADEQRAQLAAEETARNEESARTAFEAYSAAEWTKRMAAARAAFGEAVAATPWGALWLEYVATHHAWHDAYAAAQAGQALAAPNASPLVAPPAGISPLGEELGRALALARP